MSTENYKYGKEEHGTKAAVHTDAAGENRAIVIDNLHVMIVPEGNGFFAQAFEIDYGVQGSTVEEVKKRFEDGLAATIHHNIEIYGSIKNILYPNQEWYSLKEQNKGNEYDYSFSEWRDVAPKHSGMFNRISYESVRHAA